MKFIRATISNFRILRDVTINFSVDQDRRLTVIRAQNESGKTTLLTALQWALYGDKILPNKGQDFRLHPIDWDVSINPLVPIEVILDFEDDGLPVSSTSKSNNTRIFRLSRTVEERVLSQGWERLYESVSLSEKKNGKYKELINSEASLQNMLPSELREIFFTDGDRALSFIEADIATQRKKVKEAVKSLLGITIVESAIVHLKKGLRALERDVQKVSKSSSLSTICTKVESIEEDIAKIEPQYLQTSLKLETIESKAEKLENVIYESLKKGDKSEIRKKILSLQKESKRLLQLKDEAEKEHCNLFKSRNLPSALLSSFFKEAQQQISKVLEKEALPGATITVMKQLVEKQTQCLCGESLDPSLQHGEKRLNHLEKILTEAIKQGETSRNFADLKYVFRQLYTSSLSSKEKWRSKLHKLQNDTSSHNEFLENKMAEERELQTKIASLPSVDVSKLLSEQKKLNKERDDLRIKQDRLFNQLSKLKNKFYSAEKEKKELLRNEKLNTKILSELEANQDLLSVFLSAYSSIMNTELKNVSNTMNKYFIEMIGSSSANDKAIIVSSEITNDFNIKVYGPENRPLNPSQDLNGASRRALTISLILALTTVSGVEAPNIIDTPLGMMSGHVKKFVTELFVKHSTQPVLFLTRDEIAGCEDILQKHAGEVITFSNPAHYPKSLKNQLHSDFAQIVSCKCNHSQYCCICERIGDESNTNLKFITH